MMRECFEHFEAFAHQTVLKWTVVLSPHIQLQDDR